MTVPRQPPNAPGELNPGDANVAAVWGTARQRAAAGWLAAQAPLCNYVPVGTQHAELARERKDVAQNAADADDRLRKAIAAGLKAGGLLR